MTVLVADAVLEAGVVAAVLELLGACGRVTVRPAALAAAVICLPRLDSVLAAAPCARSYWYFANSCCSAAACCVDAAVVDAAEADCFAAGAAPPFAGAGGLAGRAAFAGGGLVDKVAAIDEVAEIVEVMTRLFGIRTPSSSFFADLRVIKERRG